MNVLVAGIAEEFVLDQRSANRSSRRVAVQLGYFLVAGNVGILLVKVGGCIQRVGSAVNISDTVNRVGAGGGAHVDVSAAGRALLRVVHGSVHAELLHGLRRRCRQSLADGQIGRRRALDDFRGGAAGTGNARVVDDAR